MKTHTHRGFASMAMATALVMLSMQGSARADELGDKLARVVERSWESLVTVSFNAQVNNPMAGMMGGMGGRGSRGGRRFGGRGGGDDENGGGERGGGATDSLSETATGVLLDGEGHVLIARFQAPNFMGASTGSSAMKDIKVRFFDGVEVDAEYVGDDATSGLAVIKFDPAGLTFKALDLGGRAVCKLGDPAVVVSLLPPAMGGSGTFRHTRVNGVVSGDQDAYLTQETIDDLMASPVYTESGSLIGFVAPYGAQASSEQGGFNMRSIMRLFQGRGSGEFLSRGVVLPAASLNALLSNPGSVSASQSQGWHGLEVSPLTPEYRSFYGGLEEYPGCVSVKSVAADSPGAAAGVRSGDILLNVDGKAIAVKSQTDLGKFDALFAGKRAGDSVKVDGLRDGERVNFDLELASAPASWGNAPTHEDKQQGITVRELTADYVSERRLPAGTTGVVVSGVTAASAAELAGLKNGDVITSADGKPILTISVWKRALESGKALELDVLRGGEHITTNLGK